VARRVVGSGGRKTEHLMRTILALIVAASVTSAAAQPGQRNQAAPDRNCPPETRQNTPGADTGTNLSDKLADSRGVICPPGVDPGMSQPPPPGGAIKVIPPPGAPGGDPTVQPK
jgi:hypothetical protein